MYDFDLLQIYGIPSQNSLQFPQWRQLTEDVVNFAQEIALTQSSCPPLASVPLGCPLCTDEQNPDLKYFRAVAWTTGVVEKDTLDGSDPPG